MNLSRKNKKNVNKKSSKKLTTKPRKKSSKKSITKLRKKITRKSRKKYNKNKLKFNKIDGGTRGTPRSRILQSPSAALSRISQLSSSFSRNRNSGVPYIEPATGTIVAAQVPNARVKTEMNLRNDENLLKNALNTTIRYMENVVMYLNNMYLTLRTSPMPAQAKTYLNNATAAWNIASEEGIKIQMLLNNVIDNGMVTNNHAGMYQLADDVNEALMLNNLSMDNARISVQKFLNNRSSYNSELVLLDENGHALLNEAINQTKLLVNGLNQTVDKLNVLCGHVNTMISNQEEPARGIEVPMGVSMGVPASQQ